MFQRLIIGNEIVHLAEVDSTNSYVQQLITDDVKKSEGFVVWADYQKMGRGQRGNVWLSEKGKNLTFSIFLKPNLPIHDQFLLSKIIALSITDFLDYMGLKEVKIKWPNDIYCGSKKICGLLIENSIRNNRINTSVIGIGLNVNQIEFDDHLKNPTSVSKELSIQNIPLDKLFSNLLSFIDKRYLMWKNGNRDLINNDYHKKLFWLGELKKFRINNKETEGTIEGVGLPGKLLLNIDGLTKEFDLQEIEFLI